MRRRRASGEEWGQAEGRGLYGRKRRLFQSPFMPAIPRKRRKAYLTMPPYHCRLPCQRRQTPPLPATTTTSQLNHKAEREEGGREAFLPTIYRHEHFGMGRRKRKEKGAIPWAVEGGGRLGQVGQRTYHPRATTTASSDWDGGGENSTPQPPTTGTWCVGKGRKEKLGIPPLEEEEGMGILVGDLD